MVSRFTELLHVRWRAIGLGIAPMILTTSFLSATKKRRTESGTVHSRISSPASSKARKRKSRRSLPTAEAINGEHDQSRHLLSRTLNPVMIPTVAERPRSDQSS